MGGDDVDNVATETVGGRLWFKLVLTSGRRGRGAYLTKSVRKRSHSQQDSNFSSAEYALHSLGLHSHGRKPREHDCEKVVIPRLPLDEPLGPQHST